MPRVSVREEIVVSATEEFHARGFSACSVEDITKGAGVPKGSFYNHFSSKEDLGAEVVRRYAAASVWETALTSAPALEQLRGRFEVMRERLARREFARGCLFGNMGAEMSDHSPMIRAEVESSLERWSSCVAELLRHALAAGEISGERDVERLGRFVINAWEGAVTRSKVTRSPAPLDDFFGIVFDQLLR